MKTTILPFLLAIILLPIKNISAQTPTAVAPILGNGTSNDPYRIESLSNLYWLARTTSQWVTGKYFIQTADIDATETSTWFPNGDGGYYGFPTIGGGSNPVGNQLSGSFSASYDGQGFHISNLYINRAPHCVGLFGKCFGAVFKNMTLVNPTVLVGSAGATTTNGYQGTAIFAASGSATVDNVHIMGGTLTIDSWHSYFGGMFGRGMFQGTNSSVDAIINGTVTTAGPGGGFLGYSESGTGTFTNCFTTGTISGNFYLGGFVGMTGSSGNYTFNECYSKMAVTTSGFAGGFTAHIPSKGGTYNNCFATGSVTGSVAGGFYGNSTNGVSNFNRCYSTGSVTGATSGGFGGMAVTHAFLNCFWNTQTSGKATAFGTGTNANVTGRTTTQMKTLSTFTSAAWDFINETTNGSNDHWFIDATENSGYPSLRGDIREWTGSISNSWSASTNWKNGLQPNSTSIVRLNNGTVNFPAITSDITIDRFCFSAANFKVDLGNYIFTSKAILRADANHYIKTSGTGNLKMHIADQQFLTFPVGLSSYNPVSITNRTGAHDDFSVLVSDEVYTNGISGATVNEPRVQRTWYISKTAPNTGSGVNFLFNWNPGETTGAFTSPGLYHYGSNWARQAGTTSSTAQSLGYLGYTGTFSPFSIATGAALLPVTWLNFTATKHGAGVNLAWNTAAESGTSDYVVQHKTNAKEWASIGAVTATGTRNTKSDYSLLHNSPVAGNNYYRLIQRDRDGQETYSKTVSINVLETFRSFSVYPNPVVNGKLNISTRKAITIQIYNSEGALVLQRKLQQGNNVILITPSIAGTYYIRSGMETLPFIVK
ncbi:MAG: T9SS type A sorting domain-containing protein [Chitinophagaceae bacterium]|nr:MAG: T9SS type A sorting domain-containing protein [Chitinophagaceae bacterium]